ncbi:uncharacterized protein BDR25DRAFT_7657 [Lindgomyces ingoldianus]|uniref:Uncharacterized protein n=1 Tax=Lindgomyces ingoldianus TaxID=673940 RepID=A0ACB6RFK4_9PLEO|nr:uncharacterized protein BDR25DRAFT_7657 [Lindgomyces ingoldianus]KAF2478078.1 hypothetical protein BDR25DRAFT_7657 [Lindgomyces ingoldianus]
MWNKITGKSDSSPSSKDDRRRTESTRAKRAAESIVSSSSSRRPTRTDSDSRRAPTSSRNSFPPEAPPSRASSYATAHDGASEYATYDPMADRSSRSRGANDDLYDDTRDERSSRRRDERSSSYDTRTTRKERSRSRDREDRKRKDEKRDQKKSRSDRSSSLSQTGGYRGDIVDSPKPLTRTFSDQVSRPGFSQFPGQDGAPMMSGALPTPANPPMSSYITDQFPGQNPAQFAAPSIPGPAPGEVFGAAADYYGDQGQSVGAQPGVRPQQPSVLMPLDTPHLMSASAQANPVQDTGAGAAADFYGSSNIDLPPSKPPRPSMPGAFEDDLVPPKPPRPSSKPSSSGKPGKLGSAAALAGAASLTYALGHSSNAHHSESYTNGVQGSSSMYMQGVNHSTAATDGSYMPNYSAAMADAPPPKPPRPGKPSKESSSHSNAGLYAAGAAGLAAYGIHHHSSHQHSSSMSGGFPGDHDGPGPSPSPFMSGGMATRQEQKGPITKLVDWWKDHEDVQKMEEYTEYIGVCRGCFDPRSSVQDAPRKHHYSRKRSGEFRPSGIEKQSRYSYSELDAKRKSNKAGWLAAGLGGVGLAKAGKALLNRDDFDDTYSVKSGHASRSRTSLHRRGNRSRSRSQSRDRKHHSSGRSEIRYRSRSRDRMSRLSTGVTGDRKEYKVVRHRSRSRSRSRSRDRKSGLLGAAIGAGIAASAVGHAQRKRSRSRSTSPQKVFVHHRRDSSDHDRRHSKPHRPSHRSSRSSLTSGSYVDVSQPSRPRTGGFLGGFFTAPPPKEKRRKPHSHSKKKKGFFNFGNASSSSSDSNLAFGAGYDRRRRRSTRRNSDEKFNSALVGLAATSAAIAATQAGRSKHGKHRPEVVAIREHRHGRGGSDRYKPGRSSRSSIVDEEGWESLPEDDTSSDSGSFNSGLAFGDYDWKMGKSTESLASSASGTSKWGWRWGSKKKKKPSTESLHNAVASASFIAPVVAGTAIGVGLSRHDSNASSASTLQSVYPVQTDVNSYDAMRRTSAVPTPQPIVTGRPPGIIEQPQPVHQVPGALYSSQAQPQPGYVAPIGPPVFANIPPQPSHSAQQFHSGMVEPPKRNSVPPLPRRGNSSPTLSSWKRDAALTSVAAGVAAGVGVAAVAASKSRDRRTSSPINVRFDLTADQSSKEERERRRQKDRQEEVDHRRREKQREEEEARKQEEERRRREKQRRDEEARKYEAERLARIAAEQHEADRRRERAERRVREAREAREAEEADRRARESREAAEAERRAREAAEVERRAREARMEAQRREDLEREAEQMRRERREADIREDTERRQREAETQAVYDRRNRDSDSDHNRQTRTLEQQTTGSSIASDVGRKENELQEREHYTVQPETWKSTAAAATVAGAAAVITGAAVSSHCDRSPAVQTVTPAVKTIVPAVKHVEPTKIAQDYADEEIFDPNIFKKRRAEEEISRRAAVKILEDIDARYKEHPVSQADFFAPEELKDHSAGPSPKIDPNEGAPDLHIFYAHDEFDIGAPKVPPYPSPYSFTATRDGFGLSLPYPVPSLNLIQPTPPGSRANSIRGVSLPPSPAIAPVDEPKKEEPRQTEANKRGSRVSWGENQFHKYEVQTPESSRESWIDPEVKGEKHSQDEIVVEFDSPESGKRTSSYQPEKEAITSTYGPKEMDDAPSTQYVPNQEDASWPEIPTRRMSKKDKKKSKVVAAAGTIGAAGVASSFGDKADRSSSTPKDEPVSDTHSRLVQSAIPPSSNVYQAPFYESVSDVSAYVPAQPKGFAVGEITEEPEPMTRVHMPGGFEEDPEPEPEPEPQPAAVEEWAEAPKKKGKGKKKPRSTDDEFSSQVTQRKIEEKPVPEPIEVRDAIPELQRQLSKKEKKKAKKAKRASLDNRDDTESSPPDTPQVERDIRDVEPSYPTSYKPTDTYEGGVDLNKTPSHESASNTTNAAVAGGFASLVFGTMKSDQDKTSSDLESAKKSVEAADTHASRDDYPSTANGARSFAATERVSPILSSIPSTAFQDVDELAEVKTPKRKEKRVSDKFTPPIGSPLRTEVQHEDYVGLQATPIAPMGRDELLIDPLKAPTTIPTYKAEEPRSQRIHDSGYYAPDDQERIDVADRDDRDEFFSADSDEMKKTKSKSRETDDIDARDSRSVVSSSRYDDDLDRKDTRHRRRESERSESRDRGYEFDDGEHKKKHHRRRETDERSEDWDTRSANSETRSEANGERRKKHRRRESERNGSPEDRVRSSAASEPGDSYEREHKSSKRRSKRDGDYDDTASVVSSPARYNEGRSPKKEKEKRSSGLFSLFSKSKESLVDTSSKSSKSKEELEDVDRKHRKKKHRGSAYGSDDDDSRSIISSRDRREKRRSLTDSRDEDSKESRRDRSRDSRHTAEEDQSFLGDRAVAATPLPASEGESHDIVTRSPHTQKESGIPGDRPEFPLPTLDNSHAFSPEQRDVERPKTPTEDTRALLTRLTGLQPWLLEAFPDELPPLPVSRPNSPLAQTPEPRSPLSAVRGSASASVPFRFRRPLTSPGVQRDLTLDLKHAATPASSPLQQPLSRRHSKAASTEFKDSREFRPLYLVERNRKPNDIEEVLPALPSSGGTSRTPSERGTTEDEYQSALESPHMSASDTFEDPFTEPPSRVVSPPHSELQEREIDELTESQQTTPKALSFPSGVLDLPVHSDLPALEIAPLTSDDSRGLGLSLDASDKPRAISPKLQSPLAPSALIDDTNMADAMASRSRDPSPTKSSSALQDAALGTLIRGAAAATSRHRSPSPASYGSDFMAGEPDQETIDLAAQSFPPPEPQEPEQPSVSRTPSSSSKKTKKGRKGSKGKSIDYGIESPKELTAEDHQKIREKDAEEAFEGWFSAPIEEPKPIEERKVVPIQEPLELNPNLLRRDSKGKTKGKKKKGKSKKDSISESLPPTPTEERPYPSPSSSQYIPQFVPSEEDWKTNRAESVITDDATLIGEPSASQYGGSPEISSKEFRRQKVLDSTAPRDDNDLDVMNAGVEAKAQQLRSKTSLQDLLGPVLSRKISESKLQNVGQREELEAETERPIDLWAATTPKLEKEGVVEPLLPVESLGDKKSESPVAEPSVIVAEEEFESAPKGKKGKKGKKGRKASKQVELPSLPTESSVTKNEVVSEPVSEERHSELERDILQPAFGKDMSVVVETPTPVVAQDKSTSLEGTTTAEVKELMSQPDLVPSALHEDKADTSLGRSTRMPFPEEKLDVPADALDVLGPESRKILPKQESVHPVSDVQASESKTSLPAQESVRDVLGDVLDVLGPESRKILPEQESVQPLPDAQPPNAQVLELKTSLRAQDSVRDVLGDVLNVLGPESRRILPEQDSVQPVPDTQVPESKTSLPTQESVQPLPDFQVPESKTSLAAQESVRDVLGDVLDVLGPESRKILPEQDPVQPVLDAQAPESKTSLPAQESVRDGLGDVLDVLGPESRKILPEQESVQPMSDVQASESKTSLPAQESTRDGLGDILDVLGPESRKNMPEQESVQPVPDAQAPESKTSLPAQEFVRDGLRDVPDVPGPESRKILPEQESVQPVPDAQAPESKMSLATQESVYPLPNAHVLESKRSLPGHESVQGGLGDILDVLDPESRKILPEQEESVHPVPDAQAPESKTSLSAQESVQDGLRDVINVLGPESRKILPEQESVQPVSDAQAPESKTSLPEQEPTRDVHSTPTPEPSQSFTKSLWGAFRWGKKKPKTPEPLPPSPAPVSEKEGVLVQEQPTLAQPQQTLEPLGLAGASSEMLPPSVLPLSTPFESQEQPSFEIGEPLPQLDLEAKGIGPDEETTQSTKEAKEIPSDKDKEIPLETVPEVLSEPRTLAGNDELALPLSKKRKDKKGKGKGRATDTAPFTSMEAEPSDIKKSDAAEPRDQTRELERDLPVSEPNPEDDEWALQGKKKSKKDKKIRKRGSLQVSESVEPELAPEAAIQVQESHSLELESGQDIPQLGGEQISVESEPGIPATGKSMTDVIIEPSTPGEDEWAIPDKMKGKKGKKAWRENTQPSSLVEAEPSNQDLAPQENITTLEEPDATLNVDPKTSDTPRITEQDVLPDPESILQRDESVFTPKRKGKNRKGMDDRQSIEQETHGQVLEPESNTQDSVGQVRDPAQSLESTQIDSSIQDTVITQGEPIQDLPQLSEQTPEDEWALTSLGDKKMKSKKADASLEVEPPGPLDIELSTQEDVLVLKTEEHILRTVEPQISIEPEVTSQSELSVTPEPELSVQQKVPLLEQEQVSRAHESELGAQLDILSSESQTKNNVTELSKEQEILDEWSVPSSKKEKKEKGKSGKAMQEDEPSTFVESAPSTRDVVAAMEEDITQTSQPLEPELTIQRDIEAQLKEIPQTVQEPVAEDEWAVPVSKKAKKKKVKETKAVQDELSQVLEPVRDTDDALEPEPVIQQEIAPQPEELPQTLQEYVAEDKWAAPVSRKDKKKAKGKRAAQDEPSQITEPVHDVDDVLDVDKKEAESMPVDQSRDLTAGDDIWEAPLSMKRKKRKGKGKKAALESEFVENVGMLGEEQDELDIEEWTRTEVLPEAIPKVRDEAAMEGVGEAYLKDHSEAQIPSQSLDTPQPEGFHESQRLSEPQIGSEIERDIKEEPCSDTQGGSSTQTFEEAKDDGDEWAPMSKKAKKAKKTKTSALLESETPSLIATPVEESKEIIPEDLAVSTTQELKEKVVDERVPISKKDKKKGKKAKKSALLESETPPSVATPVKEFISEDLPESETKELEGNTDVDRLAPISRTDKKSKKLKKSALIGSETSLSVATPVGESEEIIPEDIPLPGTRELEDVKAEQVPNDSFESFAPTSKGRKKAMKAKKITKFESETLDPGSASTEGLKEPMLDVRQLKVKNREEQTSEMTPVFNEEHAQPIVENQVESAVKIPETQMELSTPIALRVDESFQDSVQVPLVISSSEAGKTLGIHISDTEPETTAHDSKLTETRSMDDVHSSASPSEAQDSTTDDWGFTSLKKGRKGRKGKSRQVVVEEPASYIQPPEPQPGPLPTDITPSDFQVKPLPNTEETVEHTLPSQPDPTIVQPIEDSSSTLLAEAEEEWDVSTLQNPKKKGKRAPVVEDPSQERSTPQMQPQSTSHNVPIQDDLTFPPEPEPAKDEDVIFDDQTALPLEPEKPKGKYLDSPSSQGDQIQVEAVLPLPPVPSAMPEAQAKETTRDILSEEPHASIDTFEQSVTPSAELTEPRPVDWDFPISKNKKKDKKGKGKQSSAVTSVPEALPEVKSGSTSQNISPTVTEEARSTVTLPVEPDQPVEDDWGFPGSKKDKKAKKGKRKQSGTATPISESFLEVEKCASRRQSLSIR